MICNRTCILLPLLLGVTATFLSSFSLYGQEKKIYLSAQNISLREVIEQIEEQTSFTVAFNDKRIDTSMVISFSEKELLLEEIVRQIADSLEGRYVFNEKHILLLNKEDSFHKGFEGIPIRQKKKKILTEPVIFKGVVIDSLQQQPLVYATVCLIDESGNVIQAAVTDDDGSFTLSSKEYPDHLRISFIGYTTLLCKEIVPEGRYELSPDGKLLEDVIVTAQGVSYELDRNRYVVTSKMREGTIEAVDLLNKIHGVKFNRITNEISVGLETNVLLLVDGIQQSQAYIRSISPDRISHVEIVYAPTGRYLSEGYGAIINFKLKDDYKGYDVNIRNFLILNPAGTNGDDPVMMEQPGFNLNYTQDKWNVYGYGAYGRSHWNAHIDKDIEYTDYFSLITEKTKKKEPNDLYKYQGAGVASGVNYRLNPDHILSLQFDYDYSDNSTIDILDFNATSGEGVFLRKIKNTTRNITRENNYQGTIFYKGKLNEKTELYGDLSYNYYENRIENDFTQEDEQIYQVHNKYREDKKQVLGNIDVTWNPTIYSSFNAGYSVGWRNYSSRDKKGNNYLDYNETRNKLFGYYSYSPFEKFKLKIGTGIEYIHSDNSSAISGRWTLQPYLQMNYKPNEKVNLNASYITDIRYPSLFQLSSLSTAIDSSLQQTGNPDLKSALRHTITLRTTFWNRLTISPIFKYTPARITDYYYMKDGSYFRSFENVNMKQYILQLVYDQPLGKYFNFSSSVYLFHDNLKSGFNDLKNSENGWLMSSELNFSHPKWNLGIDIDYSRMLERSMMLQGYQMINMDSWTLTAVKQFPKQKISLRLTYILPLDWGVQREQEKWVDAGFYRESTVYDQAIYKNMLLLNVNVRFNSGQVKNVNKQSRIEKEEREKRVIGF